MHHSEYYRGLELAQRALRETPQGDGPALAAAVHQAATPALADTPMSASRACRRGCDACCHLPVGVTFAEALRLAAALGPYAELRQRVLDEAREVELSSWTDLLGRPCPLLDAGACLLYEARPLPCRALASADRDACAASRSGMADAPIDDVAFVRGLGAAAALSTASEVQGTRELRAALGAILTSERADQPSAFSSARGPD